MNDSIEALGWTLVHFCWQAAAIALLYCALDAAFSRLRSNLRYALALASLMSMLVAGAATLGYEGRRLAQESALRAQAAAAGHPLPDSSVPTASLSMAGISGMVAQFNQSWFSPSRLTDFAESVMSGHLMQWIDALWLAGVLVLSFRMFGGWMVICRLQRSTKTKAPATVYAAFVRLSAQMGIRRKVDLHLCSRIAGPLAIGVLRSTILLPASALTHLSPEQLEVVLAHELAHIRRGDYLWNIVQTTVETLFFFHPAVWWLGGRTRQLRELCCDDAALECCGDPVVYATALLRLEEQRAVRLRLAMALDGHGTGSSLKARIVRILDGVQAEGGMRRRETVPLTLAGVVALIGMFLMPLPRVSASHAAVVAEQAGAIGKIEVEGAANVSSGPKKSQRVQAQAVSPVNESASEAAEPVVAVDVLVAPRTAPVPAVSPTPAPAGPAIPAAPYAVPAPVAPAPVVSVRPQIAITDIRELAQPAITAMTSPILQGSEAAKENYVKAMQELGYNDLDKLIAMKVQGITPEYARSMAKTGYGRPSADDLIALKIFDVTPEFIEKMRAEGTAPATIHDLIPYKIFKVTPEYAAGLKEAGFGSLPMDKLLQLRIQNVTPEFAKSMRQRYPDVTVDQLVQMKIFRIDDDFIASAKGRGFDSLSIDKLVKLRMSGLLDDNSVKR